MFWSFGLRYNWLKEQIGVKDIEMSERMTKIQVKSGLHRVKGSFPFNWDLNVYRGCGHGCVYCYALYSHDYLKPNEDFYGNIYVKENAVLALLIL